MSRIGQQPILIPDSIQVSLTADQVTAKSASAELKQTIPPGIGVKLVDKQILVSPKATTRQSKALHGLTRSLIANMIIGLTQGFTKTLELQGTGYRVRQVADKGNGIELSLGFSHPVVFEAPETIKLEVKDNKFIIVSGPDKYLVGQVAANIRRFRPPDVYKGKGVRYQGEVVKLKPGKAAKAVGTE